MRKKETNVRWRKILTEMDMVVTSTLVLRSTFLLLDSGPADDPELRLSLAYWVRASGRHRTLAVAFPFQHNDDGERWPPISLILRLAPPLLFSSPRVAKHNLVSGRQDRQDHLA